MEGEAHCLKGVPYLSTSAVLAALLAVLLTVACATSDTHNVGEPDPVADLAERIPLRVDRENLTSSGLVWSDHYDEHNWRLLRLITPEEAAIWDEAVEYKTTEREEYVHGVALLGAGAVTLGLGLYALGLAAGRMWRGLRREGGDAPTDSRP